MASKSEMESEHRRDLEQWGHRVVRALQTYRDIKTEENLQHLRELLQEEDNLDYVDPFGVTDLTEADRQVLIDILNENAKQEKPDPKESEEFKQWSKNIAEALKKHDKAKSEKNVVDRMNCFIEIRKLIRQQIDRDYCLDDLDSDRELGISDENLEMLKDVSETMQIMDSKERDDNER